MQSSISIGITSSSLHVYLGLENTIKIHGTVILMVHFSDSSTFNISAHKVLQWGILCVLQFAMLFHEDICSCECRVWGDNGEVQAGGQQVSYGTKACLTNEIEQAPTRTDPDIWMGVGRPWAKGRQTRLAQDANLGGMDKVANDAYLCAIQLHL